MIMTRELVQAIDDRLNKLVPGEKTYYNDEAWNCFIDELVDSEVRLPLVEEQLLFWKYTELTDLDILDR
jgi:hypothetical protein